MTRNYSTNTRQPHLQEKLGYDTELVAFVEALSFRERHDQEGRDKCSAIKFQLTRLR